MKKVRSNALWNELSSEQLKLLDQWLFEENQSYPEAWQRAQMEFGFKGSESSVRRYYAYRRKERTLEEFKDLRDELTDISSAPGDVTALRTASMKLLGRFLFRMAQQSPDKIKEWAPVAQLLVQNDHNEMLREIKAEEHRVRRELKAKDHKLRREAMATAKERFQFNVMEQALKALPQLRELAEAKKDPLTKEYEENALINRVRRGMFNAQNVHPESAQEEAEMLAAKKERDARREREAQAEAGRKRITDAQPPPPSSQYYQGYIEKRSQRELENWEMCAEFEI